MLQRWEASYRLQQELLGGPSGFQWGTPGVRALPVQLPTTALGNRQRLRWPRDACFHRAELREAADSNASVRPGYHGTGVSNPGAHGNPVRAGAIAWAILHDVAAPTQAWATGGTVLCPDWSSTAEACNCSSPDTGNMEVLARFGTEEQKILSAYAITEPGVASSDASNIRTSIQREGDQYVINGRKHWITGAAASIARYHSHGAQRSKRLVVLASEPDLGPDRHTWHHPCEAHAHLRRR